MNDCYQLGVNGSQPRYLKYIEISGYCKVCSQTFANWFVKLRNQNDQTLKWLTEPLSQDD